MLQVIVTRGNRNECPIVGPLVGSTSINNGGRWPQRIAGDKGYSSDTIRLWLQSRNVEAVIPMRHNEHVNDRDQWQPTFNQRAYQTRNVVERCIAKLKEFRRIATRYDKLASSFMGMLSLASIVLYLRLLDS